MIRRLFIVVFLIGWALGTAGASPTDTEAQGDSLFRQGFYAEALEAYTRQRWNDSADATLLLKHFLACEYRGGDCRREQRLDLYYAEKAASPYLAWMLDYTRERVEIASLASGKRWQATRGDEPMDARRFLDLAGCPDLARQVSRRRLAGWSLAAGGFSAGLAAIGWEIARNHDDAGPAALGASAIVMGWSGYRLLARSAVPPQQAMELARRFNLDRLGARMRSLPAVSDLAPRDGPSNGRADDSH